MRQVADGMLWRRWIQKTWTIGLEQGTSPSAGTVIIGCPFSTWKIYWKKCLTKRRPEEKWSRCVFPQERPSVADLQLWNTVLTAISPGHRVAQRLREFTASGHKIWEWRFCPAKDRVLHCRQELMDMFRRLHITGMGLHPKYVRKTEGVEIANLKESLLCLVEYTYANEINRPSTSAQELLSAPPESFLDVLE